MLCCLPSRKRVAHVPPKIEVYLLSGHPFRLPSLAVSSVETVPMPGSLAKLPDGVVLDGLGLRGSFKTYRNELVTAIAPLEQRIEEWMQLPSSSTIAIVVNDVLVEADALCGFLAYNDTPAMYEDALKKIQHVIEAQRGKPVETLPFCPLWKDAQMKRFVEAHTARIRVERAISMSRRS